MPPREDKDLLIPLDDEDREGDRLRVEFSREGQRVLTFVVQYEIRLSDKHVPVVRYDTAHGSPHRDVLDIDGNKIEKIDFDLTNEEALTYGWEDLKANWQSYRTAFVASLQEYP